MYLGGVVQWPKRSISFKIPPLKPISATDLVGSRSSQTSSASGSGSSLAKLRKVERCKFSYSFAEGLKQSHETHIL